jgi:hypothetical protein
MGLNAGFRDQQLPPRTERPNVYLYKHLSMTKNECLLRRRTRRTATWYRLDLLAVLSGEHATEEVAVRGFRALI